MPVLLNNIKIVLIYCLIFISGGTTLGQVTAENNF